MRGSRFFHRDATDEPVLTVEIDFLLVFSGQKFLIGIREFFALQRVGVRRLMCDFELIVVKRFALQILNIGKLYCVFGFVADQRENQSVFRCDRLELLQVVGFEIVQTATR